MNSYLKTLLENCDPHKTLKNVSVGGNVLVKVGRGKYYLLKYGHHTFKKEDYFRYHAQEQKSFSIHGQRVFHRPSPADLVRNRLEAREAWWRYMLDIQHFGCLIFTWDEEFQLFMPSWQESNIALVMATETVKGQVIPADITIVTDPYLIEHSLQEIMPPLKDVYPPRYPRYYNLVVKPFLNNESTGFTLPDQNVSQSFWNPRRKKKRSFYDNLAQLESSVKKKQHGNFLYIGSESFCMVLGVAINDDGRPCMQDRFIASTNPILYWSIDKCSYGLNQRSFILPQMGRRQDARHYPFLRTNIEIITGKLEKAIGHFVGTEHAEGVNTLIAYANTIGILHESAPSLEGKWYF